MASSTTILDLVCAIAIFSLFTKGMCATCSLEDLQVTQIGMGSTVNGKPEYRVDIFNGCACSVSDAQLDCTGFRTAERIDPAVMKITGNRCVITGVIPPFQGTFFVYAWDDHFDFKAIASSPDCSDANNLCH